MLNAHLFPNKKMNLLFFDDFFFCTHKLIGGWMKELKWIHISLSLIVAAIFVIMLKVLETIFIPLTFAVFISMIFSKPVEYLYSKKVPKLLIISLVILVLVFILFLGGTVIYSGVQSFIEEFPKYEKIMMNNFENVKDSLKISSEDLKDYINNIDWIQLSSKISITKILSGTMGNVATIATRILLTLFFLIFLLAGNNKFIENLLAVFNSRSAKNQSEMVNKISNQLITYLRNKTLISLGTAICGGLVLFFFEVEFVIVSALLLFILNFIPNVGSILATLFPVIICFFEYGFSLKLFGVFLSLLAVQALFANFLEPKLLGEQLKLSPIIILISLVFWAWIWGLTGMIVAVPITSIVSIIISEIKPLEKISNLISGK